MRRGGWGPGYDEGWGIDVDGSGNAYVAGVTTSSEDTFPDGDGFGTVLGPDVTYNGNADAFVAKVDPTGSSLSYCGYIGGDSSDSGLDIAVDTGGKAYVTGHTRSSESSFPVVTGPDLSYNGAGGALRGDAFVALPGGFGTLEELSEVITLKQLLYVSGPIVLVNVNGYYDRFLDHLEYMYETGFAYDVYRALYHIAATPQEALAYIETYKGDGDLPQKWEPPT